MRSVLSEMFDPVFVKNYDDKHQQLVFEIQLARLAETRQFLDAEKRKLAAVYFKNGLAVFNKAIDLLDNNRGPIRAAVDALTLLVNDFDGAFPPRLNKTFKCPAINCHGFVNGENCSLCGTIVCINCRAVVVQLDDDLQPPHVCNSDDVASVNSLMSETRPCPKCAIPIFKIDGCDHMWCTRCHAAFSWETGEMKSATRVNNPHYFNWMRQRPGGLPPEQSQNCDLPPLDTIPYKRTTLFECHRLMTHIIFVEMAKFQSNRDEELRKIRIKFLQNIIDMEAFKKSVHEVDMNAERDVEVLNVLQNFVAIGQDVLWEVTKEHMSVELDDAETIVKELSLETRLAFEKLSKTYHWQVNMPDYLWLFCLDIRRSTLLTLW